MGPEAGKNKNDDGFLVGIFSWELGAGSRAKSHPPMAVERFGAAGMEKGGSDRGAREPSEQERGRRC